MVVEENKESLKKSNSLIMLEAEGHDDYYKEILTVLIKMLESSLKSGEIEKLENDLSDVKTRYNQFDCTSKVLTEKIQEVQYDLMCKYLENGYIEKAKVLCDGFDESMEEFIINRVKENKKDFTENDNYYAAMTKIDIMERIAIDVNSLKFWEGVLNIEKPELNFRLPVGWQPANSLILSKERNMSVPFNDFYFTWFIKFFKIRYDPKSKKNKMNLNDIQKLREYLIRPKTARYIRIVFEEGIENVYLDLNNTNILSKFSIRLPSTCKSIGGSLFKNSANLSVVDLYGTKIEAIEDDTFYNSRIQRIICPPNLKSIGRNAFANCDDLEFVDLSYTKVDKINRNAFYNSGINSLRVSKDLKFVDLEAFSYCRNLKQLDLSKTKLDGLEAGFLAYSGVKKVKLPSTINNVDFGVFSDCKELKEIDLSKTKVKRLGAYSFFNSNIERIKLPNTVEELEYEAFYRCERLKNIYFRKTKLSKVAPYAFYKSGVEKVQFPNSLSEISATSFKSCDNLKVFDMPD